MLGMTISMFDIRTMLTGVRVTLLAGGALALAACQTDGGSPVATDALRVDAAPADLQSAGPAEPVADPGSMTRTRAARECWMRTEKTNAHENLDRRADVVNKCIEDKMKATSGPAPKS